MNNEGISSVGIGGELERNKETVPVYQVDNIVEYVNPDVEAPFNLVEGTKTDLGLFLSLVSKEDKPVYNVEKQKYHGRAGLLGRVIIQDREERRYRDIDAKGLGYLSDKIIFQFSGTPGILNYEAAIKERDVSEAMLGLGLRASRVLSIIRLKEIFDEEGNRISIEEAKQRDLIRKTDEPVIEVRLMGTNARIQDLAGQNKHKYDLLIEDARAIVSQELGKKPEKFSLKDYGVWFAQNLGNQIAIIHRNGWIHVGLTDQNITLDGRIVDFATAEHYSKQKPNANELLSKVKWSRDIERAVCSLCHFNNMVFLYRLSSDTKPDEKTVGLDQLIKEFKESYFDGLGLSRENRLEVEQELEREIEYGVNED